MSLKITAAVEPTVDLDERTAADPSSADGGASETLPPPKPDERATDEPLAEPNEPEAERPGPDSSEEGGPGAAARPVLRFVATGLPEGVRRVDVAAGEVDPARASALQRAAVLAAAEPLCEALERWLGTPFDLEPDDRPPGTDTVAGAPSLGVRLEHRERDDVPPLTLHLAPSSLTSLPAVPESLAKAVDVGFEPLAARLRVARIPLPETALAGFGVGAALLLPESFGKSWAVQLASEAGRVAASFDAAGGAVVVAEGARFETGETGRRPPSISGSGGPTRRVDVLLDDALALDPGVVIGARGCRLPLSGTLAHHTFRLTVDDRLRFRGHLAPLGDGYGFIAHETHGD